MCCRVVRSKDSHRSLVIGATLEDPLGALGFNPDLDLKLGYKSKFCTPMFLYRAYPAPAAPSSTGTSTGAGTSGGTSGGTCSSGDGSSNITGTAQSSAASAPMAGSTVTATTTTVSVRKTCRRCLQRFDPAQNARHACRFHKGLYVCRYHPNNAAASGDGLGYYGCGEVNDGWEAKFWCVIARRVPKPPISGADDLSLILALNTKYRDCCAKEEKDAHGCTSRSHEAFDDPRKDEPFTDWF